MKNALMVFVKNPVLGKVKTRLAATIGPEKALAVYQRLLTHTRMIGERVVADRYIFYSDVVVDNAEWRKYKPVLQLGEQLGEKMENAFAKMFDKPELDYEKAVIIGSDCLELTTEIISDAFDKLDNADVVLGPAADGGYYLLGMKQLHPSLFKNKSWSTANVLQQTLDNIASLNLSYQLLPVLNDIDDEQDLMSSSLRV